MLPQPHPALLTIAPYVGGESAITDLSRAVRLMSNENPFGPSAKAVAAFHATAGALHLYPSGGHGALRSAIATAHGLDPERIVCGNGSDEIIQLLAKAYAGPGDEVIYPAHGFLMYPIATQAAGATPVKVAERALCVDPDTICAAVTERTRIVFLANPANPTGTYLPFAALQDLRQRLPARILLVIDAAYAEYADQQDYQGGEALVATTDNTVVLRTFSKLYGLAALRVGYGYCPPAVASILNRIRGPFNVNASAQAAAIAALADQTHRQQSQMHNTVWRQRLTEQVIALGFPVIPSAANFVLVQTGEQTQPLYDWLKDHHIYVRKVAAYGLPQHLRVTIGRAEDLEMFLANVQEFCQQDTVRF
jgi:histidinol-phosphate aminotransferase